MDQNREKEQPTKSVRRRTTGCGVPFTWILLLIALGPWLWNLLQGGLENRVEIDYYPTFRQELISGNVIKVTVSGELAQGDKSASLYQYEEQL